MMNSKTPTDQCYDELSRAYQFFNQELFESSLPSCLITLQRKKRTYGYFSAARFATVKGVRTDEIAMNPMYFAVSPVRDVLSTLVHEMAHLWQRHFGRPGRRGYHNREWADKMLSIGLHPSSTGRPGGREVGERMSDYVIENAKFAIASENLLSSDWSITWFDRFPERSANPHSIHGAPLPISPTHEPPIQHAPDGLFHIIDTPSDQSNRRKYRCATCETAVWGKPGLALLCGDCGSSYVDTAITQGRSVYV
jgi:hypothetical protein